MISAVSSGQLAIHGGTPVRTRPFPSWPKFSDDEVAAVADVMRSGRVNYWTGDQGREFEREFAAFAECRHAVAVANGTVALELALRAFGIGQGDDVITSSRTFVASASCISMVGARPVFADVDSDSGNITASTIRDVLTPRTRAVIAVHLAGWPCDMASIMDVARERNLIVIEDCAQAQGATLQGRSVGSFGDAAAFSFCQDKIMTTLGEGGMLVTSDSGAWECASAFKNHGRRQSVEESGDGRGFRWLSDSIGTNWRMTEVQAAVGRIQLRKTEFWLRVRRQHATTLAVRLKEIPLLRVPLPPSEANAVWYRFYAFLRQERLKPGWNRDRVLDAIIAEGVPCFAGSCSEVYLEKAFRNESSAVRLPVARQLGETSLAFLTHPELAPDDIADICSAVGKVMREAGA